MNITNVKIMIEIPVPNGYTIEFRSIMCGEQYVTPDDNDCWTTSIWNDIVASKSTRPFFVLVPIVQYRTPVMPDDFEKEIQVRDSDLGNWKNDVLYGYRDHANYPYIGKNDGYRYARIVTTKEKCAVPQFIRKLPSDPSIRNDHIPNCNGNYS